MFEAVAALVAGFLLAFLLGGPSASAKRHQVEEAAKKARADAMRSGADLTATAPNDGALADPAHSSAPQVFVPHKATQTAHRYREDGREQGQ